MSTIAEQLTVAIAADVTRCVFSMPDEELEGLAVKFRLRTKQEVVGG